MGRFSGIGAARMRSGRAVLGLGVALLVLAPGCGLFKPTEPETPRGSVVHTDYTSASATLATLARAIQDRGATTGQSAYLDGLADDFLATHLASVVQRFEDQNRPPPPQWTRNEESRFYAFLTDPNFATGSFTMRWTADDRHADEEIEEAERAILARTYSITRTVNGVPDTLAFGYATLTFRLIPPDKWVVTLWQERDLEPGDDETLTFSWLRLDSR